MKKLLTLLLILISLVASAQLNRTVNISDSPFGFKRKVTWNIFLFDENAKEVKLYVTVKHFDDNGIPLQSKAVKDFERIMMASSARMVNPANGLRCTQDGEVWTDALGNVVANPVDQFTFFETLIQNAVNIPILITSLIQQEDQVYHGFD